VHRTTLTAGEPVSRETRRGSERDVSGIQRARRPGPRPASDSVPTGGGWAGCPLRARRSVGRSAAPSPRQPCRRASPAGPAGRPPLDSRWRSSAARPANTARRSRSPRARPSGLAWTNDRSAPAGITGGRARPAQRSARREAPCGCGGPLITGSTSRTPSAGAAPSTGCGKAWRLTSPVTWAPSASLGAPPRSPPPPPEGGSRSGPTVVGASGRPAPAAWWSALPAPAARCPAPHPMGDSAHLGRRAGFTGRSRSPPHTRRGPAIRAGGGGRRGPVRKPGPGHRARGPSTRSRCPVAAGGDRPEHPGSMGRPAARSRARCRWARRRTGSGTASRMCTAWSRGYGVVEPNPNRVPATGRIGDTSRTRVGWTLRTPERSLTDGRGTSPRTWTSRPRR